MSNFNFQNKTTILQNNKNNNNINSSLSNLKNVYSNNSVNNSHIIFTQSSLATNINGPADKKLSHFKKVLKNLEVCIINFKIFLQFNANKRLK